MRAGLLLAPVVGWSIADHVRSELVVDALQMARWNRPTATGTIVHSDRGSQSAVSGGPSREMSCLSKIAAIAARSAVPAVVAGPSSSKNL